MFVNKTNIKLRGNKKAISELVSYVLLITLAIAMAAAAWFFLKPYAEKPLPEEECPESVSIVIENYSCNGTHINYTLSNRGLHNVDGVQINVVNPVLSNESMLQLFLPEPSCNTGQIQYCSECQGPCLPAGGSTLQHATEYNLRFGTGIKKVAIYPINVDEKGMAKICTEAVLKIPIENCLTEPP